MLGIIDGIDFGELNAMKYYAPPAGWSDQKKKENVRNKVFSNEWLGAEKKDGYFTKLVKDEEGNILLYSRSRNTNGEYVNKKDWVPQLFSFFNQLPNGTCLLGELYFPNNPGSKNVTTIMQCLKEKAVARQEKGDKLYFYIFDVLAAGGKSLLKTKASERFDLIMAYKRLYQNQYVQFAKYVYGEELWSTLQKVLGEGGEGMVITYQDALYEPDKRPSKTTLKVKKELRETIDCFFTGRGSAPTELYTGKEIETWDLWQNERTGEFIQGQLFKDYKLGAAIRPVTKGYFNHWYGSLEIAVLKDGQTYSIGWLSGLSDEMKANPKAYALKPIEVTAMEIDYSNGISLRHGKMIGWRNDLTIEDCTYDKILGDK